MIADFNMSAAKDRERFLEVSQNHARSIEKLKTAASGKVHVDSRNDPLFDRDVVQEIRDCQSASKRGSDAVLVAGSRCRAYQPGL